MNNNSSKISFETIIILIVGTIALHVWSTQYVWNQGTKFYEGQFQPAPVLDIVHNNTTDRSAYNDTKNWFLLVYVMPFLLIKGNSNWITEAIVKLCIVFALRSLTMVTTILPKNSSCKVKELDSYHLTIGGTCYDKMFSGHFAFGLLATSILFKYGFMPTSATSIGLWTVINIVHAWLLTVTRGHYTQDLLVAIYVVALVHFGYDTYLTRV